MCFNHAGSQKDMSAHFTEFSVCARYAELPGLMREIARQTAEFGCPAGACERLQLVVEELFTNTIAHGYGGECTALIQIGLSRTGDSLTLRYIDQAIPFDPGKIAPETASTAAVGGLGLGLIQGMSKSIRYQRLGPHNVTELDF